MSSILHRGRRLGSGLGSGGATVVVGTGGGELLSLMKDI